MKEIILTNGKLSIIDDCDVIAASGFKWFTKFDGHNYYAMARMRGIMSRKHIFLHKLIMQPPQGRSVDHVDGNGLNNTRANLRVCSHEENMRNKRMTVSNRSGFKGVSWKKKNHCWVCQIRFDGVVIHLGLFDDKIEAAKVYDTAAKKYFGKFARTNRMMGLI